jgi:uncharacterized protein YodC (DUF2158 family)
MAIEPGDVVALKSGGQSMTVAAVEDGAVECLWIGDNGELYRETIPGIALTVIESDVDPDDEESLEDEEGEDKNGDDEDEDSEDEDEEDEEQAAKKKRRSA